MNKRLLAAVITAIAAVGAIAWWVSARKSESSTPASSAQAMPSTRAQELELTSSSAPEPRDVAVGEHAAPMQTTDDDGWNVTIADANGNALSEVDVAIGSRKHDGRRPWFGRSYSSESGRLSFAASLARTPRLRDVDELMLQPTVLGKETTHDVVERGKDERVVVSSPGSLLFRFHVARGWTRPSARIVLRVPEGSYKPKDQMTISGIDRGQLRVPCELNLRGTVSVGSDAYDYTGGTAEFVGPTRPGECVVVDLDLGMPYPIVVADLRSADGKPLATERFAVELAWLDAGQDIASAKWDRLDTARLKDGAVRAPMYVLPPAKTPHLKFLDMTTSSDAIVEISRDMPPGDTHIGTVTLGQLDVALRGRVVDEQEKPIVSATVWVYMQTPEIGTSKQKRDSVQTGRDGTFEWRTRWEGDARIQVTASEFDGAERRLRVPSKEFQEFRLTKPAPTTWLGGSVLVDDPAMSPLVYVELETDQRTHSSQVVGTSFGMQGVALSTHSVSLHVVSSRLNWPIVSVGPWSFPLSEHPTIDARGAIRVLDVQLVDTTGKPLADAVVYFSDRKQLSTTLQLDRNGRLKVALSSALASVEVSHDTKVWTVISTGNPQSPIRVP